VHALLSVDDDLLTLFCSPLLPGQSDHLRIVTSHSFPVNVAYLHTEVCPAYMTLFGAYIDVMPRATYLASSLAISLAPPPSSTLAASRVTLVRGSSTSQPVSFSARLATAFES
jgi:hypothetical protein